MQDTKTHPQGLSEAEVLQSRAEHGANILTPPAKEPLWRQFLEKFSDPLIIILLIAGCLSVGISCWEYWGLQEGGAVFFEPVGIFIAILLATGIAFIFELQADKEFAILNHVNDEEPVEVIRGGNVTTVPRRDVVVGDLVIVNTGDEIPADGELLEAVALQVNESTLNGESVPAHKSPLESEWDPDASYPTNMLLRGTTVMEGHGLFRVTAVGDRTENGKVYEAAQIDSSVRTPLNEQLDRLSGLITKGSYLFAGLIIVGRLMGYFHWAPLAWLLVLPTAIFFLLVVSRFDRWKWYVNTLITLLYSILLIGGVILLHSTLMPGGNLAHLVAYTLDVLMVAVTLIVVAVPEGLPMAVTLSLAYSMRRMMQTNNLVRRMHACETMGATTVICTDKTGTLTRNQMHVRRAHFYALPDETLGQDEASRLLAEGLSINSTASLDLTNPALPRVLGNPTEGALLLWLREQGIDYRAIREETPVLQELPFNTERKCMATIGRSPSLQGARVLYLKGAPEIVFSLCRSTAGCGSEAHIAKQLAEYQAQAMRTLGFAYQVLQEGEKGIEGGQITAQQLIFQGIVAISDPVREDVPQAVAECQQAGIAVKIVTGDTPGTAREIGRQIGLCLPTDGEESLITGPEFAELSDLELDQRVPHLKIIARARPMDKKRLVESLQRLNEVVAVTGDGTNDAPALQAAHVGLSMGSGTSVAKEASDITIIDNSFSSIGKAVMWGRSLYANIQRFLLFQLTVNVAACFLVLSGAFMSTDSPLTVTQMLWVNLIMDTFAAMALASLPPSPRVMQAKPRDRNAFIITPSMGWNIVGVGGFFYLLLLVLLYIFEHAHVECLTQLPHIQLGAPDTLTPYELTLLFTIFVMTHFFYLFNARAFATGKSGLNFRGARGLLIIVVCIFVGQIAMVEIPCLQRFFNIVPGGLKVIDWVIILTGSSLVLWARELWSLLKRYWRRKTAHANTART